MKPAPVVIYLSVPPGAMQSMIDMLGREGWPRTLVSWSRSPSAPTWRPRVIWMRRSSGLPTRTGYYSTTSWKEAVENILALRFANGLIESAWDREHLESVQIDA